MSRTLRWPIALVIGLSLSALGCATAGGRERVPNRELLVSLGQSLFFERRLSTSGSTSCASCHLPDRAFADDRRFSVGDRGRETARNTPALLGRPAVGYQFWDGRAVSLVEQVFGPLEDPDEMSDTIENAILRLQALPEYRRRFHEVFDGGISAERLARSIAAFVETLHAMPSDYEVAKAEGILSPSVIQGEALFRGKGKCDLCHSGGRFTDERFHNTGVAWKGSHDLGRAQLSGRSEDTRAFKTPSLIELMRTAPYMHDGSLAKLDEVVEHYAAGGSPEDEFQDPIIEPIELSTAEREDLVAFLRALSSERAFLPP